MPLDRLEFLKELDSQIWVKDRIFLTRYLVLHEITQSKELLSGLNHVISILPSKTNVIGSIPSFGDNNDLCRMAYVTSTDLDLETLRSKYSSCPCSTLEQFFSDFEVYGLREALAYLCKAIDFSVSKELGKKFSEFYGFVGNLFLNNTDKLKSEYKKVLMGAVQCVKSLQEIMPEGYISEQAKVRFLLDPSQVSNHLRRLNREVLSEIDINGDGAVKQFMLAESLDMGGFWENGQEQSNLTIHCTDR